MIRPAIAAVLLSGCAANPLPENTGALVIATPDGQLRPYSGPADLAEGPPVPGPTSADMPPPSRAVRVVDWIADHGWIPIVIGGIALLAIRTHHGAGHPAGSMGCGPGTAEPVCPVAPPICGPSGICGGDGP